MKEYYKISEISKLYGIGIDSLRYYEKLGILKPRRDTNNYRLYSLHEIYKLNVIQTLRKLDFSMKQIKDFLDNQSIDNTLALLHEELSFIEEQLKTLQNRKQIINDRISYLKNISKIQTGTFAIQSFPDRPCVQLKGYISRDEEIDFIINKIHRKYENKIVDLGTQAVGAFVSMDDFKKGIRNIYSSVFFILNKETEDYDFILPAGQYISYYYRGDYLQNLDRMEEVLSYAQQKGYTTIGGLFELYKIDNQETIKTEEFLTEIQIRVEK